MDIGGAQPPSHVPVAAPGRLPIAARVLYMLVFGLIFWIVTWVLALTAVAQLLLTLLANQPNAELVAFSRGLSRYVSQVIEFLTFLTDRLPFPFAPWPNQTVAP